MALSFEDSLKAAKAESKAAAAVASFPAVADNTSSVMSLDYGIATTDYGIATADEGDMIAAYSGVEKNTNYESYSMLVDDRVSEIDKNKNIKLADGQINLTQESNSQYIPFKMLRYYDGYDLNDAMLSIYWVNQIGSGSAAAPVNVTYDNEYIYFAWLVDSNVTRYAGKVQFEIQARGYITSDSGTSSSYVWKSRSGEIDVLQALEYDEIIEPDENWQTDFFNEANKILSSAQTAASTATLYASQARTAASEANTALGKVNDAVNDAVEVLEGEIDTIVTKKVAEGMGEYAKSEDVESTLVDYAKLTDLPVNVSELNNDSEYATETYVDDAIANAKLDKYATVEYVGDIPETDEDGNLIEAVSVIEYIDYKVDSVDVSEQLESYAEIDYVDEKIGTLTLPVESGDDGVATVAEGDNVYGNVTDFVIAAMDSVDVSEEIGDLGDASTVKEYVDTAVANVDVSGQLGNLGTNADGSKRTVTQYVENKLSNIKLDDYTELTVHNAAVKDINDDITEINKTLQSIDTSPRANYVTTYNEAYTFEGVDYTGENALVLYEIFNKDKENEIRSVVSAHKITGGSGGGSSNTLKIDRITDTNTAFTVDDNVVIEFTFTAVDEDGKDLGQGIATWKLGSKTIINKEPLKTGKHAVDLTEYFNKSGNDQKLTLIVTDDIGTIKQANWYVSIVDVKLESSFDSNRYYDAGKAVDFKYTPYGGVDKTVHFIMDGDVENEVTQVISKAAQIRETTYSVPAQSHGAHLLEVYVTADVGEKTVESNHIVNDIIWYDANETAPVIGCSQQKFTTRQYDTTQITYSVYDPLSETPDVVLVSTYVDENGETVEEYRSSLTMTSNTGYWQYRSDVIGEHTLTITCGETVKTLKATVEKLDIGTQPVTAGLAFDFNPIGCSNDDADRLWSYDSDTENSIVSMSVSDNFDWINGGYQIDDNGDSYFCIKAGTTATINYKMFCPNYNIKSVGGHYKLVFKTTKVQNASQPFMQCYKNNVGVVMKPQEANFYAGSGNHLYLAYSEEDIIEFELNMGENVNSSDKMVMGYEDGVATKPLVYTSGATFIQGVQDSDAEYVTLGSTSCDLHIYRFKAYRRALDSTEILDNFILDSRNAGEMIKRYDRNQIYEEGNQGVLTPEYLAEKCRDLRIIMISAPNFTTDKDTKIGDTTIQCIYTGGRAAEDNWIAYDCVHSGQGTSSNLYGAAGRNIDLIMKPYKNYGNEPYIVLGDDEGTQVSKISLTETSVPTNYLNIKVNIASSENANNAILAKRYNRFNPYHRPFVREDGYAYDIKDTMEFQNCVVFIRETDETIDANGNYINHTEFNDTDWHFYGIGNIGDSKKTDSSRMNDPDDVNEFVVEIMDNNLPNSKFQSGVEDENGYSVFGSEIKALWQTYKDDTYEIKNGSKYTPVTNSIYLVDENIPIFYELIDGEYVLTSDETISANKTYYEKNYPNTAYSGLYKDKYYRNTEGKIKLESGWGISFECRYEHDDSDHEEHRRIWNEFYEFVIFSDDDEFKSKLGDYCVLNSVMFYYLFTLRYTMIDNRAKNSFWHYGKCEDGVYRFDLTMDYDNDTALGIDNFGKQVYRYGYEDIDYVDSELEDVNSESRTWVFNAATSTFYKRLRDKFGAELSNLYNEIDNKTPACWKAEDLITEFDNSQSQFPEELWRKDIERKYIRPYTSAFKDDTEQADPSFLKEKMNGRKKYHRRQFERNQEKYMASKFRTTSSRNDIIRMRAKPPSGSLAVPADFDLTLTPYAYMYVSVDYGNGRAVLQERAVPNVPVKLDYPLDSGDIIAIENASNLISVGDLSPLYTEEGVFTSAIRLKDLVLGNKTVGYSNTALLELNMVKDGLLEVLNIENIPSLDDELDLGSLKNIKTVKAKGSGIQGLTLAKNGLVESLSLPESIDILNMKNLSHLNDIDIESLDSLSRLTIENCDFSTIDSFVIDGVEYESPNEITILNNAPNLQRVRLTGINWNLSDTQLLDRLYSPSIGGYDANEKEITHSVLAGYVYVPIIKESKYDAYKEMWSGLEIGYGQKTEQHEVTFVNDDGTILEVQYVDNNQYAIDPVTRDDNPIPIPKKKETVSTEYTFAGWDTDLSATRIGAPRTVRATYTESTREYTVKYVVNMDNTVTVKQETKAPYGSNVIYSGETPVYTKGETIDATHFYLFDRWDKSGIVDGDKTVTAVFEDCQYVEGYFENKELIDMKPVEVYALMRLVDMGVLSCDGNTISGTNIQTGDDFSFTMGYDIDFDDIESIEVIPEKRTFTGATGDHYDTGIKLFDEDRDFVLAIDYEIASGNQSGAVLMQCFQNSGSNGFKLSCDASPSLLWGDSAITPSSYGNREMAVLRHVAGDNKLYVYISNTSSNAIATYTINKSTTTQSDIATLVFGAAKNDAGRFSNYCVGDINWCKIWYMDLGVETCKKLVSWTHEKITLEVSGFYRYALYDDFTKESTMSLLAKNLIGCKKKYNNTDSVAGGWASSVLNNFLNTRFYDAIPSQIKAIMKKVSVSSHVGNSTNATSESGCFVSIPSAYDVDSSQTQYKNELYNNNPTINYMISNSARIRRYEDGEVGDYWLRTPDIRYTRYPMYVDCDGSSSSKAGSIYSFTAANTELGVLIEISL